MKRFVPDSRLKKLAMPIMYCGPALPVSAHELPTSRRT
jgi:hypothetical protein